MSALQTSVRLIPAVFLAVTLVTATDAEGQNPTAFTSDVRPIMERSCWDCHGEDRQRSGLDLRTREGALRGGEHGAAIVPGRAEESLLYRMVAGLEEVSMPRDGASLTVAEIAAVREVVADMTPEQVNEDRLTFAEKLIESAVKDFDKLGLEH